jgi:hypothetical protein
MVRQHVYDTVHFSAGAAAKLIKIIRSGKLHKDVGDIAGNGGIVYSKLPKALPNDLKKKFVQTVVGHSILHRYNEMIAKLRMGEKVIFLRLFGQKVDFNAVRSTLAIFLITAIIRQS